MKDTSQVAQYRRPYPGTQPAYHHGPYNSSARRAPQHVPIRITQTLSEVTGPLFGRQDIIPGECDMTFAQGGEAIGQRINVSGRVLDENGRPVSHTLVEVWQANAAGRYLHQWDQHNAPLDPHFSGEGHVLTDEQGRYSFRTIQPGSYPWGNHYNAWRPAHIHFSLFGPAVVTRLITQMYFPGDPMLPFDPIFNCTADDKARHRLISQMDWETTTPQEAIGYRFDIVLRGAEATPLEDYRQHARSE